MKFLKKTKFYKLYRNILRISELNERLFLLEKENECLKNNLQELNKNIEKSIRISNENLYATIFHDTIKDSEWLNIPLSLSSGAIGYPYAYILYRTLDQIKPKKILETGLGQSTKIITEYVKKFKGVSHDVVEHDKEWINFFKQTTDMSKFQNVHLLESYRKKYNGVEYNAYKNFEKEFKNKKFNLICIDGPVGYGEEYSRMDIIDIVPKCLEEQFVILIDDCERIGEQRTISLLEEKLNKNNISFLSGYQYWGNTSVYICVSPDLEFLRHI